MQKNHENAEKKYIQFLHWFFPKHDVFQTRRELFLWHGVIL